MKLTKSRKVAFAAAATLAAGAVASTSASADSQDVPSFQEFSATAYQDTDGQYIVNGDEPESSLGSLRQFYDSMVTQPRHVREDGLVINTVRGKDDRWSQSQVGNLTYCVSTDFGARHDDVVAAMAGGAGLWEGASSAIDFVHVEGQDADCDQRNRNVLFSVEPVQTSQYIARAFFPSTKRPNVLVDDSIWSAGSWTPANIMGHELGHTLGFRHEHTRPEAGTCFEDDNWRELTPYDSASIMHYPQCNGSSDDLSFTALDGAGARAVYGD